MEKGNMPIETDLNDLKETDSLKAKEKDNAINYKEELINEKIASLDNNENKIEKHIAKFFTYVPWAFFCYRINGFKCFFY